MQKQGNSNHTSEDLYLLTLVEKAKTGDKESMNEILQLFEEDILKLIKFIPMPREDANQALITEFLSLILEEPKKN
ncbi:helix-turn-helix domain-containing protein [Chengkuizengella sp. SCS-71B]|uniref:helix-turn-helix domain-containing protein n=1 Tax=Chengkuizengella sp. SCS-71B TaxID=3115290 RepID=UPI0032C2126A